MATPTGTPLKKIQRRKLQKLVGDAPATAKAVNLVYVNDSVEGIQRMKNGTGFRYLYKKVLVKDKEELARIRGLVLPPAWRDVWICPQPNGHLQATGIDVRGRKQYHYHPLWNELRNMTKFYRMLEFGKALPAIRHKIDADLRLPGMPKDKVLATVVSLMERTSIRVGSSFYEKLYGSFGMTTLKNQHVKVTGAQIQFIFKGKKGVEHRIHLKNKKLAFIVQQCRELPGKELFQYVDEAGNRHSIDSGMVNEYIKSVTEADFTAKDFRTWAGTCTALVAYSEAEPCADEKEIKKKTVEVLDKVSLQLGNTRTVCRKYYVHPSLITLYEEGRLAPYVEKLQQKANEEEVLIEILEKM